MDTIHKKKQLSSISSKPMRVEDALSKAMNRIRILKLKKDEVSREDLYHIALLYLMENLIHLVSSGRNSV